MPFALALVFALASFSLSGSIHSKPFPPDQSPALLRPWVDWVVWDQQDYGCPGLTGGESADERQCVWPTRIDLTLDERGGRFVFAVKTFHEKVVTLPGNESHWPQDVTIDGRAAVVENRNGYPHTRLAPGTHNIGGVLLWDRWPETLALPDMVGIVSLTLKGKPIPIPALNENGDLWIAQEGGAQSEPEISDALNIKVYRRIADGVPVQVVTHLDLEVAGKPRELLLPGALLDGAVPVSISSDLPVRLEPNGHLRVQSKPGQWPVEISSRLPGQTTSLTMKAEAEPWPKEELWTFAAAPGVRLVEIEGVAPVDPRQTDLPESWKSLPAYRLESGGTMAFKEVRRGDPEPEPDDLILRRRIWLDFDGGGYTASDAIKGRITRGWRLSVRSGVDLGRVAIDGEPQSVTRGEEAEAVGVEVRKGALDLNADSRLKGGRTISATGWNHEFRNVSAELNLPPGWRLLAATGVDEAAGTWIGAWTLLDLFVVLITALAVGRLWSWPCAALALSALLVIWHEPGAPRYAWLNLLAATALSRVLPPGRLLAAIKAYRTLSFLTLLLIAVPFVVDQVRQGIYPQLAPPASSFNALRTLEQTPSFEQSAAMPAAPAAAPPAAPPLPGAADEAKIDRETDQRIPEKLDSAFRKGKIAESEAVQARPRGAFSEPPPRRPSAIDPNAITQTGPGLPEWSWTRVPLSWNGPVLPSQEIGLILLPPVANLALGLVRVGLVIALAWLFARGRLWKMTGIGSTSTVCWALAILSLATPDARAEFPNQQLLDSLRDRLTAPADCAPECATVARMKLAFTPTELQETLEVHAAAPTGLPLPARLGQWLPSRATVDGKPAESLFRGADGIVWLAVGEGRHTVMLAGPLPSRDQVQIPLPLKPLRVESGGSGWQVDGIRDNGVPDVLLQLNRDVQGEDSAQPTEAGPFPLPPMLQVQRVLRFSLDWSVQTTVSRLSPAGNPVSFLVPLLQGESVVTAGLHVDNGKLAVNLPAGQSSLSWDSVLEKQPEIELSAGPSSEWSEVWQADVSPIWHMEHLGLVPIRHQSPAGHWLPEWRPWPGETLKLHLTRPTPAPGETLTVDRSDLSLSSGARAMDGSLIVQFRSSQAGQQVVRLPEGAVLQAALIDGMSHPLRQQGRTVTIPIRPGSQTVTLNWRSTQDIASWLRMSELDLGHASVNATGHITLGQDRWVLLTGGPRLGPAVLYWGVLLVILGLSYGLSRAPMRPLSWAQWILLLIGLSQVPVQGGVIVGGWLFVLAWRERQGAGIRSNGVFNGLQIAVLLLTLWALLVLLDAVRQGLLGTPVMQVAGNGSDAYHLHWYQDRADRVLPRPWVLSAPLWVYRTLMLGWALWLAYSLLNWLNWGWRAFAAGGLWRRAGKSEPIVREPDAPGGEHHPTA